LTTSPQQIYIKELQKNHKIRDVTGNLSAARQPTQNVWTNLAKNACNKLDRFVRCEVLTAVLLRIQVFRDVMLCHWVGGSSHIKELHCTA
jgi:hypothetical protein